MLSAAAAWDGLAAELQAAATSFSSVTSELAGAAWQGRRRRRWQPRPHPTWGG
ncbi:PPE family protein [Mycobacterium kansasii]|uniref:PPE family protein n=1 Tax=Mycobacterium kansasii TaxID=1768 RepID=A0A1V3XD41_MYCKA|nr:PPE family protein [Mycobacterium kansasii]